MMKKKQKEKDFITNESDKKILESRAIIALSLLLILTLLCAYYQTNQEYYREYPPVKNIVFNYSKYIGETISISGEVVDVHSITFQLLVKYEDKNKNTIFMVLPDSNVDIGDKVEVLGTLNPDYLIYAEKIIVSKRWKHRLYLRPFIYCTHTPHIHFHGELGVQYKANGICEEGIKCLTGLLIS